MKLFSNFLAFYILTLKDAEILGTVSTIASELSHKPWQLWIVCPEMC